MLNYVPTSKFSVAKLVGYRKHCSCKLKFHCQIYILMFMSKVKYARVKKKKKKTCPLSHGNFDGIFVGLSGTNKLKATHSASYKHDFRLFWLATSLKSVQWKLNRLCWPTCSPLSAYGIFCAFQTQETRQLIGKSGPIWTSEIFWCSRASNSDHIWSQFELVRGLIPVQVFLQVWWRSGQTWIKALLYNKTKRKLSALKSK